MAVYQSIKLKNLKEKFFRNFKVFPKTYYGFHYWHYSRIFCVAPSYHLLIIKANSRNDSQNYYWKAYSWVETISRKWKPFNPIWGRLFQGREVVQLTILDIFKSISWTIWLKICIVKLHNCNSTYQELQTKITQVITFDVRHQFIRRKKTSLAEKK